MIVLSMIIFASHFGTQRQIQPSVMQNEKTGWYSLNIDCNNDGDHQNIDWSVHYEQDFLDEPSMLQLYSHIQLIIQYVHLPSPTTLIGFNQIIINATSAKHNEVHIMNFSMHHNY